MVVFLSDATIIEEDRVNTAVYVDRKNSVSVKRSDGNTYHNFVGKITDQGFDPDTDPADIRKVQLNTGARLSFSITAQASGKFVIYQIITNETDASVTYKRKTLQTTKVSLKKNNLNCTVVSKAIYLEAGTYFISMEGSIAKKGDTNGFYNVDLNYIDPVEDTKKKGTKFYVDDDNGDNNWLYDKKKGINTAVYDAASFHIDDLSVIQLDTTVLDKSHTDDQGITHVYKRSTKSLLCRQNG